MTDQYLNELLYLRAAVHNVQRLLESKGLSDSGREYSVYHIGCVHIGQEKELDDALKALFKLAE